MHIRAVSCYITNRPSNGGALSKNRNGGSKRVARQNRKIEGRLSRNKALHLFSFEMRRWRGPISRRDLAEIAGVHKFVLCAIEHEEAHLVRIEDVLKVLDTIGNISPIPQDKENEIRSLLKLATRPKSRRTCHRQRFEMGKRR